MVQGVAWAESRLAYVTLALITVTGLIAAAWLPVFHDAEGYLIREFCLLPPVVLAALTVAAFWRTPSRRAAAWFALFIAGQGLALQLIDAGPTIHYQHYRIIHGVGSRRYYVVILLLVLQSLAALAGLWHEREKIAAWIGSRLGLLRTIALCLAVVLLGIFPSRELNLFATELAVSGVITVTQIACLVLGMLAVPRASLAQAGPRMTAFLDGTAARRHGIDRVALYCALWTVCVSSALAVFSYERHPHIPDEFAYIYHANYFAQGRLSTPAPPVPEAVDAYLMDCNAERCISPVPPGWPAFLAIGSRAGVPWLVNPLLAGINVMLIFVLLQRLYDRHTARLGVLLTAASPWYHLLAMSFMTHHFSLTCALVAALAVVQMREERRAVWGIPGGIAIGLLSLTRPLEGLMVASVLGLAALFIAGQRFRLAPVFVLGLSSMLAGALVLPYNKALTGDPGTFPIMAYTDRALGPGVNALGFGPDKGIEWGGLDPFPGHGLRDVLANALLNLEAVNIETFGWSIGSLLPILLFLAARSPGRINRVDGWMLFFIAVVFGYQSLYWFSGGPDFGARYYFLIIVPVIALTARAIGFLGADAGRNDAHPTPYARLLTGVVVLCVAALTVFLPWRAIDKYHHYRGMRPDVRTLLAEIRADTATDRSAALLLIRGEPHPDLNSALVYGALDPYGDEPVIAWDRDAGVRQRLLAAYPDRNVWLIDGPSVTGSGYRIQEGPVKARSLIGRNPL